MLTMILVLFAANVCIYVKIYTRFTQRRFHNNSKQLNNVTHLRDLKKEAYLVKTAVLLMTVMFLAYLPTVIALVYEKMHGVNAVYLFGFLLFAYTLLLLNSTFNPLFYCLLLSPKSQKVMFISVLSSDTKLNHLNILCLYWTTLPVS